MPGRSSRKRVERELLSQVLSLAASDFKSRFSGSYLGIFWGVIQPLSTIILFWFVFQVGFRSNPVDDVPFILWLSAGMIPWNFFYDAWYGGTSAFTSYSYIVKKVVFRIEVLPLVKILSSFILNVVFNVILLVMLALALSYITATLNVFIKDIGQFIGIILQVLMWMTPMMWPYTMVAEQDAWLYKLNPLHYVINGYRESLIQGKWFFYHWVQMLGRSLMHRMKGHFADVL